MSPTARAAPPRPLAKTTELMILSPPRPLAKTTELMIPSPPRPLAGEGAGG